MHATGQHSASALAQARPGMLCILLVARSCVWAVAISSNWLRCVCALCVCIVCACVYMCVSTCVCIECSYVLCVWGEVRTYFIHHWKQQLCLYHADLQITVALSSKIHNVFIPSQVMAIMFKVWDLTVTSPATVCRCGMVYLEPSILGLSPFVHCWLHGCLTPSASQRWTAHSLPQVPWGTCLWNKNVTVVSRGRGFWLKVRKMGWDAATAWARPNWDWGKHGADHWGKVWPLHYMAQKVCILLCTAEQGREGTCFSALRG